jgi:hypothetical protein
MRYLIVAKLIHTTAWWIHPTGVADAINIGVLWLALTVMF